MSLIEGWDPAVGGGEEAHTQPQGVSAKEPGRGGSARAWAEKEVGRGKELGRARGKGSRPGGLG